MDWAGLGLYAGRVVGVGVGGGVDGDVQGSLGTAVSSTGGVVAGRWCLDKAVA